MYPKQVKHFVAFDFMLLSACYSKLKKTSTSQGTHLCVPASAVAGVPKSTTTMRQLMEKALPDFKASVMKTRE